MGFFQDLGLDELVQSFREMSDEITGLKDDLISGVKDDIVGSVSEPAQDLKNTIQDITGSITDTK